MNSSLEDHFEQHFNPILTHSDCYFWYMLRNIISQKTGYWVSFLPINSSLLFSDCHKQSCWANKLTKRPLSLISIEWWNSLLGLTCHSPLLEYHHSRNEGRKSSWLVCLSSRSACGGERERERKCEELTHVHVS